MRKNILCIIPMALAGLWLWPLRAQVVSHALAAPKQPSAILTEAQARRGQALYDKSCAACYGLQLEGVSAALTAVSV